jgi:hypothetical protein
LRPAGAADADEHAAGRVHENERSTGRDLDLSGR